MLNEILQGAAGAIRAAFGEAEIYRDEVRQGLSPPCFFLGVLKPGFTPLLGRRSLYRCPLDIQYFPETPEDLGALYAAAETLAGALEFIVLPDGSIAHGTGMDFEVEDGVLHFFVTYSATLLRPADPAPMMETLETHITLKQSDKTL